MNYQKGQIGIWTALIGATGMITAAGLTGWFSASSAIQNKVSNINTEVQVTKTTEEIHYKELGNRMTALENKVDKGFEKIDGKLDFLIKNNNGR